MTNPTYVTEKLIKDQAAEIERLRAKLREIYDDTGRSPIALAGEALGLNPDGSGAHEPGDSLLGEVNALRALLADEGVTWSAPIPATASLSSQDQRRNRESNMMCEACARGDHANCGMQTWCSCDSEMDGDHGYYPSNDPYDSDVVGAVCLGCGSRGCQNPNCGPLDEPL